MDEILRLVTDREKGADVAYEKFSLLEVDCNVAYNAEVLFQQLMSYVKSHIREVKHLIVKMSFTMIVDNELYDFIQKAANSGKRAQVVHLSYCSKEKGTIRALRFEKEEYNIYLAQKTPAIFIECDNSKHFYYVIKDSYLQQIKFKLDGYKFFEHILNKLMNIIGSVLFHSAAVEYGDGDAMIIIGPKRAGKTTLFMDLIRVLECRPIAFDKCHLVINSDVTVYGMPTRLRVLAGTLGKYGKEMEYLIPEEYRNADSDELWKGKSESKIDMSFADFERFCRGKRFVEKSKLKYMIIPNIAKDNSDEVRLATFDEFREICMTQIFTPENPEEDWWSDCGKTEVESMKRHYNELVEYIWKNIPIVKISTSNNTQGVIKKFEELFLEN